MRAWPWLAAVGTLSLGCGGASPRSHDAARAPTPVAAPDPFTDLVMTEAQCTSEPRATISRAEALADVDVVARIVRQGWAGYETTIASGGDVETALATLRRRVADLPEPVGVAALQTLVVNSLQVLRDNHFALFSFTAHGHKGRASVGASDRAYTVDLVVADGGAETGAPNVIPASRFVGCEGHATDALLRPTVIDGAKLAKGQRPIVLAAAPPPPLVCTLRDDRGTTRTVTLPMRRLRSGARPREDAPAFELREAPIPLLTVRTFWGGKEGELQAFAHSATTVRSSDAIVVDVRGNGGGGDMWGSTWLQQLSSDTIVGQVVDRLDTEVTRQGIVNDNLCELAEGLSDPAARAGAEERLAYGRMVVEQAARLRTPIRRWVHRAAERKAGDAPGTFRRPLVIVANDGCASACESFLSRAKQIPSTVVVGENTGGVGVFAEVLVYRLPNSGLGVSAGMKHFHHDDATRDVPEGRGVLPDWWLDADDPASLGVRIADCLAKPGCPLSQR